MAQQIQLRRDTAANWTSVNPILASGEIGIELDTSKHKIGDGATVWNSLSYAAATPTTHASSHTNGTDDIQDATAAQKGLATATQITKLDGIEAGADVTDAANVAAAGAVMDSDISAGEGFIRKTGAGAYEAIKSNLSANVAPIATDDSSSGYAVGSLWVDTTADEVYQCVDATASAAVWKNLSNTGTGGIHTLQTDISYGTTRWFPTQSLTYELAAEIMFPGSTAAGTPSAIKVVAWVDAAVTGGIRVYDITNSQVICEKLDLTSTTKGIVNLGTLSNIPASEAIWEIQAKRIVGGGSDKTYVSAAIVEFG